MPEPLSFRELLEFHHALCSLKKQKRRGWELRGLPDPESIADHAFAVSALTLVAARRLNQRTDRDPAAAELSVERALATALIHEMCEAVVGDIVPTDGVDPEEKRRLEEQASQRILSGVDPTGELLELWRDFEYQRTAEGALVKQLDRLEMALQALDYEQVTDRNLDEFFASAEAGIHWPELREIMRELTYLHSKRTR